MDNSKNDEYYLERIKYHFDRITDTMENITYDMYIENEDIQDITMFNIIQISENVKQLTNEYKTNNPNIPWKDIYGLRNRLVHDYGNVVLDIVYETLTKDIPTIRKSLLRWLRKTKIYNPHVLSKFRNDHEE